MGLAEIHKRNENHRAHRAGWLRAAVLGANDGLVSTASLMIGVVSAQRNDFVVTAGLAGIAAGAMSMAVGEYVSVRSQNDIEESDRVLEMEHLAIDPEGELEELTQIYQERGISRALRNHYPLSALGDANEQRFKLGSINCRVNAVAGEARDFVFAAATTADDCYPLHRMNVSAFVVISMSRRNACSGVIVSATMSATASIKGTSMPTLCAISNTAAAEATPSTVLGIAIRAFAIEPSRPKTSPKLRLRDSGEPQLATKSPIPARPAADSGSAP